MIGWVVRDGRRPTTRPGSPAARRGETLAVGRAPSASSSTACITCHGEQTRRARARRSTGLFGNDRAPRRAARRSSADEAYIRESILNPQAKLVAGYPADHADLPGPDQRGGAPAADRVHQVAVPGSGRGRRRRRRRPPRKGSPTSHEHHATAPTPASASNYLNADYGVRSWLLTTDHKRIAILYLIVDHGLLRARRPLRRADPARAADARGRPRPGRHLQQALHDARRHDGVLLPDPGDPGACSATS